MLSTKYITLFFALIICSFSCSKDDDVATLETANETENLVKTQDVAAGDYTIELFTKQGTFHTGYNKIWLRVKDNNSKTYIEDADLTWTPIMKMTNFEHSSPKSNITKVTDKKTLYEGYIIYQMANEDGSGWSLKFDYTIDDKTESASQAVTVMQSKRQGVSTFMGDDETRYVMALINPETPKIAVNDITVALFKMENMMTFSMVKDYTIMLDPRMPDMGNHSSPNNKDLTFDASDSMYHGKLSLTMTGYWVLNLKLMNDSNDLLKGEDITETNTKSSLYLDLEF